MNCYDFEGWLEALLEGALAGDEHARCVDHVASCDSCRALVEPMGLGLVPASAEPPASLLQAVLAQTSRASRRTPWAEIWRQWMLRLARNCCIDRIRSRKARAHDLVTTADDAVERASLEALPEESLIADVRRALLHRALATLTATNREIVILKDIQQLRLSDISTRLGLPLGTVKSRSNRARLELAKAVRSLESAEAVP